MATRKQLEARYNSNEQKIEAIKSANKEINRQWLLLSDKRQQFAEKMETQTYRENRKKVTVERLVGRRHWRECFTDGDDPNNKIWIDRSEIVRINGEGVNGY